MVENRSSEWVSEWVELYLKIDEYPVFWGWKSEEGSPARTASLSSTTRLNMKRIYLEGEGVRGPSFPSRCRILVARTVCSQSSINSHRWARPVSLLSGFSSMMLMMQSTIARLYSKPPCRKQTHEPVISRFHWSRAAKAKVCTPHDFYQLGSGLLFN